MIRQDAQQLKDIYHDSCNQLMGSVREFASFLGSVQQLPETELNRRRRSARSLDDFLKKEYHNVPRQEFKQYVWLEAVRQGHNDGLTEEETYPIEHFDELDVEGQQGKLDSTILVYFLKWCGVGQTKEKRLYQYFCDTYIGRYSLLVWSAVSKERKDQRESGITDRGATATFQKMIEKLQEEAAAV